ncbi:DUF1097 domain-containing protein [Gordonia sp. NPDC003376]
MNKQAATVVVIGLAAAASVPLTTYAIRVPMWAMFIAWASYAAAGGGAAGVRRSLPMTLIGVVAATAILAVAGQFGGGVAATAVCVAVGAGSLVAISGYGQLDFTPASFLGCATTVGLVTTSGRSVTSLPTLSNPVFLAIVAMGLGALVGYLTDRIVAGVRSRWAVSA